MDDDATFIQPGWAVHASDGEELGTVFAVEGGTYIVTKKGLLGEKRLSFPRSAVASVETRRVELTMTRAELEQNQ